MAEKIIGSGTGKASQESCAKAGLEFRETFVGSTTGYCVPKGKASSSYTLPLIVAAFAAANNPDSVRAILVSNGLVGSFDEASTLSEANLTQMLYSYYLNKGNVAYRNLLLQFRPDPNGALANDLPEAASQAAQISLGQAPTRNLSSDLSASNLSGGGQFRLASVDSEQPQLMRFGDGLKNAWREIVGTSTTTQEPTVIVSTETKTSPMAIGMIIGGVLLLGILAYVFFIKR